MNENQSGVILETILDKVNGFAKGQQILSEGQGSLEKRFNIKSYMVAIDDGLNDHERRIRTLEKAAQA